MAGLRKFVRYPRTTVRGRDSGPTVYAVVSAQWGDTPKALEWLETALRLRTPGLEGLKTYPLLDPLRNEPRF